MAVVVAKRNYSDYLRPRLNMTFVAVAIALMETPRRFVTMIAIVIFFNRGRDHSNQIVPYDYSIVKCAVSTHRKK